MCQRNASNQIRRRITRSSTEGPVVRYIEVNTRSPDLGDVYRHRNRMFRFLLLSAAISFVGCHRTIVEHEAVTSPDGQARLLLRYDTFDHEGFNFHDLLLQAQSEDGWTDASIVWTGTSDVAPGVKRWVSSLDSLNDDHQTAIIQVATMGPPDASGASAVEYAWVRWDLNANALLKTLHVCDSPFDTLPPERR